jgi:hypothetical protein
MREVCFCGRVGEVEDRVPTYGRDGDWGLACPACGHLDRLAYLPAAVRQELLGEATRRQLACAAAAPRHATHRRVA